MSGLAPRARLPREVRERASRLDGQESPNTRRPLRDAPQSVAGANTGTAQATGQPGQSSAPGPIHVDLYTEPAREGVSVVACPTVGDTCSEPVVTGRDGSASLVLERRPFSQFGEWRFETTGKDLVSWASFCEHPLVGDRAVRPVVVLDRLQVESFPGDLGPVDDPFTGAVLANITDCLGTVNPSHDNADSTGPTAILDVPARGPFFGVPARAGVSGYIVWFFGVPEGVAKITVLDPQQRVFTSKQSPFARDRLPPSLGRPLLGPGMTLSERRSG